MGIWMMVNNIECKSFKDLKWPFFVSNKSTDVVIQIGAEYSLCFERFKVNIESLRIVVVIVLVEVNTTVLPVQAYDISFSKLEDILRLFLLWKNDAIAMNEEPFFITVIKPFLLYLSKNTATDRYSTRTDPIYFDKDFICL